MADQTCTCGHPFRRHNQSGTTARVNGPTTKRACALCECWVPKAVKSKPGPIKIDYTREELIELCAAAVVPMEHWRDRDSAAAQVQLGQAWVLLRAGCPFTIDKETDYDTVWVEIRARGFNAFEYGDNTGPHASGYGEGDNYDETTRYIPTRKRLDERVGEDWY